MSFGQILPSGGGGSVEVTGSVTFDILPTTAGAWPATISFGDFPAAGVITAFWVRAVANQAVDDVDFVYFDLTRLDATGAPVAGATGVLGLSDTVLGQGDTGDLLAGIKAIGLLSLTPGVRDIVAGGSVRLTVTEEGGGKTTTTTIRVGIDYTVIV